MNQSLLKTKALILMLSVSLISRAGEPSFPETPFGERLQAIVHGLKNPTPESLSAMIRENLAAALLDAYPMEAHLAHFQGIAQELGPFTVIGIQAQIPDQIYLDVKTENEAKPKRFLVEFDPNPPNGLIGIQQSPYVDMTAIQAADFRRLHQSLTQLARENEFSGALYIENEGRIVFVGAYGYANKRHQVKNHLDTRFDIGSITKSFTRLGVLLLARDGKLAFEDSINQYLPELPKDKAKITVGHLLRHESGLTEYWESPLYRRTKDQILDVDDYVAIIKDLTLDFPPGSAQRYSNAGYNLLGAIIQRVSGQTYYDFMRDRIFSPLGMLATDFSQRTWADADIATGYTNLSPLGPSQGYSRENTTTFPPIGSPSGGCYSTVFDLASFEHQMIHGALLDAEHTALYFNLGRAKSFAEARTMPIPEVLSAAGGAPGLSAVTVTYRPAGLRVVALSNYDERLAEDIGVALFRELRAKHQKATK